LCFARKENEDFTRKINGEEFQKVNLQIAAHSLVFLGYKFWLESILFQI